MLTFVIYDISCSKTRNKVADICLDYGLQRIQLSAFEGFLSNAGRVELARRLKALLKDKQGEAQIITACKSDWKEHYKITSSGIAQKKYGKHWDGVLFISGGESL